MLKNVPVIQLVRESVWVTPCWSVVAGEGGIETISIHPPWVLYPVEVLLQ